MHVGMTTNSSRRAILASGVGIAFVTVLVVTLLNVPGALWVGEARPTP